ncbi:hypothetical protein GCM10009854_01170 [Saccharopolyspora halophila]|uniref:Shedu protein SduA C-terminal domain-containing protein n=1 Tax=Saccharopolyspora halophila TaxID=405551 RepID=A0ABP5SFJ7_9PSEU
MTVRADWTLERQLEMVEKEAVDVEVKDAINTVLRHMRSGKGRHRRGGATLVKLLEIARLRASEENEWDVVCLIQDALYYATGRILRPDFEERYRLFQEGARNEGRREFVASALNLTGRYVKEAGRKFLDEHTEATANELLTHLVSFGEDARFLEAPADRPGRYRILRGSAETAAWLERVLRDRIDVEDPVEAARRIVTSPEAIKVLVADEDGRTLLKATELKQRSDRLSQLRNIAADPSATEHDLQHALEAQPWIFGGRFVGAAARRRMVPGDEVDIPLLRADGALHIVELKRAMGVPALVKWHRNALVPTADVHDAVAQAINYLVRLDENRHRLREEFSIETRRASAVVLIGHPAKHPQVPEEAINEALRTLNTHVNRVEVLTYKELLDNAERSLGGAPIPTMNGQHPIAPDQLR